MISIPARDLAAKFGDRLRQGEALSRYTSARVGGLADVLILAHTPAELAETAFYLRQRELPFLILGSGSNVLVSDAGVRGVVVINQAKQVRFDELSDPPTVWAESGAKIGILARQAATRGLAGLEWATGIPGTLGGAVVGNAGAHGADMSGNLIVADILHLKHSMSLESGWEMCKETWSVERFGYEYRSSILKRKELEAVVLVVLLRLARSAPQTVQAKMDAYTEHRRKTQPPGASMGSMFKNPPGDFAGRLIEAAGLKGKRIGDAQISPLHANFFVNCGNAKGQDILALIRLAQKTVAKKMGVELELEIELVGDWEGLQ